MDAYLIFDNDGLLIDQVRTSADRSWALITETSARFYLSIFDPKANPYTLNFGNILLILNSDGLPPWVGMIDQVSFDRGAVVVWAYTPERWFNYRRGPRGLTLRGKAGEIFSQMITLINSIEQTPLAVGNINSNTGVMEETLRPIILTNNLARILQRSGEGYRWRPEIEKGKLTIFADWFPNLVLDTGLILQDGYNISGDHPMSMSAPVNDYLAYGIGSDWQQRIISQVVDAESRGQYGLRQASDSYNTKVQAVLDITARTMLDQFKQPKDSVPITALNQGDTFQRLLPGALATYTKLVGQGFSSDGIGYLSYEKVIRSMTFDPAIGNVQLSF